MRLFATLYVLGVAATATVGFTIDSTATILIAAFLALPSSVLAVPGYYLAYGVLALVPGANPSSSTGSASCSPDGSCQEISTGEPAAWFPIATDTLGILALIAAAVLNVVLVRAVMARSRQSRATFG